jgi:hypothetical protein
VLNWSAAARLSPAGAYVRPLPNGAWDPYHINAINEDSDGNLLLTARHLSAVIKIDRRTGRVLWKLGGRDSDFRMGPGATFYYPHDAQRAPDGSITIFDNRSTFIDRSHGASRAIDLDVDAIRHTATLAHSFASPAKDQSTSQGNVNQLPNGNFFVGWGSSPFFSEYAPDGRMVFSGRTPSQIYQSYRAFKQPWVGTPRTKPAIVAQRLNGRTAAYVSWNGATQVAQWRLLAGSTQSMQAVATVPWQDFETRIVVPGAPRIAQVEALDASGAVIGRSDIVITG